MATPYLEKLKAEMEGRLGCKIEIVEDGDSSYPCKMEYARNYARNRHVLRVNPARCVNAYDVEPVTREFRALKAERDAKPMSAERKALFDVIVGNYVRDGVWTLTAESFRDLLRQRYSSLAGAYAALGFSTPGDAMSFYDDVQHVIYAA